MDVFISEMYLRGFFYQDKSMKYNYDCYPEVLMVDSTYK